MTNSSNFSCPCSSGITYSECCQLFHKGTPAKTAQQLMRARFSAYALNLADYIINTTHPASRHYSENKFSWKRSIAQFSHHSNFKRLDVLDFIENGNHAVVAFTAHITQDEHDSTFSEKSYFEKLNDKWFYLYGRMGIPNELEIRDENILPLAYYGEPVLRKKAEVVTEITADIKKLVNSMIDTMESCNGIGLAAPQVHQSLRIFIIKTPTEVEEGKYTYGDVKVLINPKLSLPSKEQWELGEGCLSIPTIHEKVKRPLEITVEYTNLDGELVTGRYKGREAQMIMHENDHINGILFIDRLSKEDKLKCEPQLKNLEKRLQVVIRR